MRQMWLGIKFFCGTPSSVEKKFGELSTEEIQEITDNAIPVTTKKTIKYVSVYVSLKSCKISNTNLEILFIREDNVTTTTATTIFTLMLLNGLLVLVEPNFRNRRKKCQKNNWMFFGRVFAPLRGIEMTHCQFTKVHQWKPSESRHWSFPSLAAAQ